MTQIRWYIDEDAMRNAFVGSLRRDGLDVVTVADIDRLGVSDVDQLAWATDQDRVLYTFNVKDFSLLHAQCLAQRKSYAGIVVVLR
jgi:hypothetical protein